MRARLPLLYICGALLLIGAVRLVSTKAAHERVAPYRGTATVVGRYHDGLLTVSDPAAMVLRVRGFDGPPGLVRITGEIAWFERARNPGALDYLAQQSRRGVGGQITVRNATVLRRGFSVRTFFHGRIAQGLSAEQAAIQHALVLGVRDDLGELRTAFNRAGLGHFLSLSGLHVSVLLVWLRRFLPLAKRVQIPLLIAVLAGFLALSGMSPSVVRAAVMGAAALLVEFARLGRPASGATLMLAASMHIAWQPRIIGDVGWQLSYLAVFGLIVFLPICTRFGTRIWPVDAGPPALRAARPWLLESALVSLAAQLPTLPIVAHTFGFVPLFSIVSNVVATPLLLVALPLGFLSLAVAPIGLSSAVNALNQFPLQALIHVTEWFASWPVVPWGAVGVVGFSAWALALVVVVLAAHSVLSRFGAQVVITMLACATFALAPGRSGVLEAWFLDVGQGDAILLRMGNANVLVDAGGSVFSDYDVGRAVVLRALRALGVFTLDLAVITHPHADHALGMLSVLAEMPVERLGLPPPDGSPLDEQVREHARARGVPIETLIRGQVWKLPGAGGYELHVLHPPITGGSNENESSIVLSVVRNHASELILTGDAGMESEAVIAFPPTRVLKVGHHGSRFSTSAATVAAMQPEVAVVQVGRNTYGHPHPEVVTRLTGAGATVLNTLQHGAVHVRFYQALQVQTKLAE